MKRLSFMAPLVVAVALALALASILSPTAEAATYTSTVEYVKDGDTLMLTKPVQGTREVRLLGIDTPETFVVDGKDPGNQIDPHGNAATDYLSELLPKGTDITLVTDEEEFDGNGRLLAYIYKGDLDVNEDLLRKGLAATYVIWPNTHEANRYQSYSEALTEAQAAQVGIWDNGDPLQEQPFEYRLRMFNNTPNKYVGDFDTKEYVAPEDYEQVSIENRVFFFSEQDAIDAGYTKQGEDSPNDASLYINELLPDPDTNYDSEWIEIYNDSTESIDLSGYKIDDLLDGGQEPYTIPSGTVIPAQGYYVWETQYYFNNSGDDAYLIAPNGTIVDAYSYTSSENDHSWYRTSDGGEWSNTMDPTPTKGAANE
ncbi:lamin tail domain-containing protein [Caldalkalibacillus salinus]|uniref:lamin tail domain-containing protein n=1 Tax=Caldalkalibacillus salinus TaxID=2803787 RepID=UPI0019225DFB|nr:lamin tail domain-containing protein [Caldalkalibacillus salinus]